MKVTNEEYQIQGGYLCDLCGSSEPCGNILDCGWWTAGNREEQETRDKEMKRAFYAEMEAQYYKDLFECMHEEYIEENSELLGQT